MNKLQKYSTDSVSVRQIDIIQTIENQVIDIAKTEWPDCYKMDLDFWVSRLFGKDSSDEKIILTIRHMDHCFSRYLYPEEDSFYGNDSLLNIMCSLYNQTM